MKIMFEPLFLKLNKNSPAPTSKKSEETTPSFFKPPMLDVAELTATSIKTILIDIDFFLSDYGLNPLSQYILVGCEDAFESCILTHACFDLKIFYQLIASDFIALSKKYPNVLFSPTSFYVSTPIPISHIERTFQQDDVNIQSLKDTTCYVTHLCPILYNGKLIRILRKGEKLSLNKKPIDDIERIPLLPKGKLKVESYHEDNLTDLKDKSHNKHGCCYLGKTLLPNEKTYIQTYLELDVEKNPTLFQHAFQIEETQLYALICAEFHCKNSTTATELAHNPFDYVLHLTDGCNLPPELRDSHRVYIQGDKGNLSKLIVEGEEIEQPSKLAERSADDYQKIPSYSTTCF